MRPLMDYYMKAHALGTAVAAGGKLLMEGLSRLPGRSQPSREFGGGLTHGQPELAAPDWALIMRDFDVISIDLFDTLVSRLVYDPTAVHILVGRRFEGHSSAWLKEHWRTTRLLAEHKARRLVLAPDVTLDEIYEQVRALEPTLPARELRDSEIRAELLLSQPTRRGMALWAAAQSLGKPIVVSTDIYLPRSVVRQLLTAAGYSGWTNLYVSGDDRTAKHDGSTFQCISAAHPGQRILHIGDNRSSDYVAATAAGLSAFHLRRPLEEDGVQKNRALRYVRRKVRRSPADLATLQRSVLASLTENWLATGPEPRTELQRIGYCVLGPALLGFVQQLASTATDASVDKLVFLAREGALLKMAFDRYTNLEIETEYAAVSTRLLGAAQLTRTLESQDLAFLTKTPVPLDARHFVARILPDLEPWKVDELLLGHGVQPKTAMSSATALERLTPVFQSLSPQLAAVGDERRSATIRYLRALRLEASTTAIVDVGWAGTIQASMSQLLGSPVRGFYWGLRSTTRTREMSGLAAWVDQRRGGSDARLFAPLYRFSAAFEVLLAHPTAGSAASVTVSGTAADENFEHTFLPLEFNSLDQLAILTIQEQALVFVDDARSVRPMLADELTLGRAVAHERLVKLLSTPSLKTLKTLRGITFDGTYGASPQRLGNWWLPPDLRPSNR